jgi:hypothetical protein
MLDDSFPSCMSWVRFPSPAPGSPRLAKKDGRVGKYREGGCFGGRTGEGARLGEEDESAEPAADGMELVVSALRRPGRRGGLAAALQQAGAVLDRHAVLLLVPAALGNHRRRAHRDRLLRDRALSATPRVG